MLQFSFYLFDIHFEGDEIPTEYANVAEWAIENKDIGKNWSKTPAHFAQMLMKEQGLSVGDLVAREVKSVIPKTYSSRDLFCTKHPNGTANSTGAVAKYL